MSYQMKKPVTRKSEKMSRTQQAIQKECEDYLKSVDLSEVDRDERPMMRDILSCFLGYPDIMPCLKFDFYELTSHYNVTIRGFTEEFDLKHFCDTFVGNARAEVLRPISSIGIRVVGESGGQTVMRVKVLRAGAAQHPDPINKDRRGSARLSMSSMAKGVEISKDIDLSQVDRNDRPDMRNILMKFLTYQETMPLIQIGIYATPSHYNTVLEKWTEEFDCADFCRTFLDEERRDEALDGVLSIKVRPLGPKKDKGPNMCVRVQRSGGHHNPRRRRF